MPKSILKLTEMETHTLNKLLYKVIFSSDGMLDILEVFSREDFGRL